MRVHRRGQQALPETRQRSKHKARRRKAGTEETPCKANANDSYGRMLQKAVRRQLARMQVPHRIIPRTDPLAYQARVELTVETQEEEVPSVDFQYTLRLRTRPKIAQFLRAAIRRKDQTVPRVYLEIEPRGRMRVHDLADRVARAIRRIADTIRSFPREAGNAVGLILRLDEDRKAMPLEVVRLIERTGTFARQRINEMIENQAEARALEDMNTADRARAQANAARFHSVYRNAPRKPPRIALARGNIPLRQPA